MVWVPPQGRELDSLEPVLLHPLPKKPRSVEDGQGGGWSHRQKNHLACVWDNFPLWSLIKHVLLTKVIQLLIETEVQQVSTIHRQS